MPPATTSPSGRLPATTRLAPAALALLAAALLLPGLGGPILWSDEGDTAVFARTVAARGLPWAWDGVTFTDSDRGRRLTPDLLLVGTPWLPYYVTAASFAALGESAWTARIAHALAGLAAVLLLHALLRRSAGDARVALAGALLLLGSVQFLLFARQARHTALQMLLTLAVLWAFERLERRPRDPWLPVFGLLLFHTHPLPALATLGGLAALCVLHPAFRPRLRPLAWRLAILVPLAAPWLWISASGLRENASALPGAAELPARLAQTAVELSLVVPALGWVVLGALAWRRRALGTGDRRWLWLAGAVLAAHAGLAVLALSVDRQWAVGLRYVAPVLPLAAGVGGLLAVRATAGRVAPLAAVLALLVFTHVPGNAVFWLLAREPRSAAPSGAVKVHVPPAGAGRLLRTEWAGYARELRRAEPGTVAHIVGYLREHAAPGEVVVTNYAWDPIYFHTRLPQGLKILPGYEIAPAARAQGLPDYVFGVEEARWLVWRPAWDGYQGYRLARVERWLAEAGLRPVPVARIPETLWENRPELAFHRFPGVGHLFPADLRRAGLREPPPAVIYRVVR